MIQSIINLIITLTALFAIPLIGISGTIALIMKLAKSEDSKVYLVSKKIFLISISVFALSFVAVLIVNSII